MPDYTIDVLRRAAAVLTMLGNVSVPVSLTEVHRTVGIPKNTVFRILHTLHQDGFVDKVGDRWCLGRGLWQMVDRNLKQTLSTYRKLEEERSESDE